MSDGLRRIVVRQGDTLEGVAAQYLGYVGRWREMVPLNRLRQPFISDRPADWFGAPLTTGILGADLAAGDEAVTIPGESARVVLPGTYLLLERQAPGGYAYEAPIVKAFDPATGEVTLDTPLALGWATGTRYRVCPADIDTRVLKPGDELALPDLSGGGVAPIVQSGQDLIALYGRDIALGRDGRLQMAGRDLATVAGLDNVGQALRFRAQMPHGTNLQHPQEGNRAHELIGQPQGDATTFLARDYTRQALLTDSRVREVPNVRARQADLLALELTADVTLAGSLQQVRVNEILGGTR
jgi:phage baseplate assembly protein W